MNAPMTADAELMTLLSDLSDRPLTETDMTPTTVFLSALVAVLSGVIMIDGVVAVEEEERLQALINSFVPPEEGMNPLVLSILKGVEHQQVYLDPSRLLQLLHPLSNAQRLMVMGLGYEMAAADGAVDLREKMYLQAIANRLNIPMPYIRTLEVGFTRQGQHDPDVLVEIAQALSPMGFADLDPVFEDIARSILVALPTCPEEMLLVEETA